MKAEQATAIKKLEPKISFPQGLVLALPAVKEKIWSLITTHTL